MIRRAEKRDVPALMELLVQVNMVHHEGRPDLFKGPTTKYSEEELAELLSDDGKPVFVYEGDSGEILGHAFCVMKEHRGERLFMDLKTLYVDDICVSEAARGKGVGKALYEHVLGFAKESGCYNLELNVWSCNPGAVKFYERMGLVPQKIGMEKILNA